MDVVSQEPCPQTVFGCVIRKNIADKGVLVTYHLSLVTFENIDDSMSGMIGDRQRFGWGKWTNFHVGFSICSQLNRDRLTKQVRRVDPCRLRCIQDNGHRASWRAEIDVNQQARAARLKPVCVDRA